VRGLGEVGVGYCLVCMLCVLLEILCQVLANCFDNRHHHTGPITRYLEYDLNMSLLGVTVARNLGVSDTDDD